MQRVVYDCDTCGAPAQRWTVTPPGGAETPIDVCEVHDGALKRLLPKHGLNVVVPPEKRVTKPTDVVKTTAMPPKVAVALSGVPAPKIVTAKRVVSGAMVREARRAAGLTQEQLARKVQRSSSWMGATENMHEVSVVRLERLRTVLSI